MMYNVIINVSKFTGPVAKDMFPTFLGAQEASVGRYGAVIKRVELKGQRTSKVKLGVGFSDMCSCKEEMTIEQQKELSGKTDSWRSSL